MWAERQEIAKKNKKLQAEVSKFENLLIRQDKELGVLIVSVFFMKYNQT